MTYWPRKVRPLWKSRMTKVEVFAPAKINLTLHITGQRADGYHILDSLVKFGGVGDRLTLSESERPSFSVTGPFAAAVPARSENLVLQAAALLPDVPPLTITLEKNLPAASGIGGGSADAAAVFRGLLHLVLKGNAPHDAEAYVDEVLMPHMATLTSLGADMPVCLLSQDCRVRGIGDEIEQLDGLPDLPAVLVNPGVAVETPGIFATLERKENSGMPDLPRFDDLADFTTWLGTQRNDLEAPAVRTAPVIADVLDTIRKQPGLLLARMSGSGATCFGIFEDRDHAMRAAKTIGRGNPDWWVQSCIIGSQFGRALPKIV